MPWQLAQGKVLYRDIAYLNGPLSPYFNSSALSHPRREPDDAGVASNIAILAGVMLMLHRLTARMSDEFAATVAHVRVSDDLWRLASRDTSAITTLSRRTRMR